MAPRLTICRCCATGRPVYACCPDCERKELHALLLRRGQVQDNPLVVEAFAALVESYRLDACDATDRAWSAL